MIAAGMVGLVDTWDLKSQDVAVVWVRAPLPAPSDFGRLCILIKMLKSY